MANINIIKKAALYFHFITVFLSCKTDQHLFQNENKGINSNFSGSYFWNASKIDSNVKNNKYTISSSTTLFNLSGIQSKNISGNVQLQFRDNRTLEITYTDSLIEKKKLLTGKFKKAGYFQCFIKKKVIQIPPLISFIYGRRLIDRLRFGVTQSGQLLIQNKYVSEGSIFIFGSGVNYKLLYYFNPVAN